MEQHEGGCLCGQLRYVTTGQPDRLTICHCTWCQRRTGSAFGVEAPFSQDRIAISGEYKLWRSHSDESGRWLDRHFCPDCGCSIGFTLELRANTFLVDVGSYDDPHWIKPDNLSCRFIFMDSAQIWSNAPPWADTYAKQFRG